jgi:hypothetical protein
VWHPLSMIVSFILFSGFAILIKKDGGYQNTKIHGYLMSASVLIAFFGWYVIYSNKELQNKPHLVTLHAQIGVAVLLSFLGLGAVGYIALNPDTGLLRTNKSVRFAHKWGGRLVTVAAFVCCCYGFNTIDPDTNHQLAFAIPLGVLSILYIVT